MPNNRKVIANMAWLVFMATMVHAQLYVKLQGDSLRLTGNYQLAEHAYQKTLTWAISAHDTILLAQTYNALGFVHSNQGNHVIALDWFLKAQKIALEKKDDNILTDSQSGIANVNVRLEKFDLAIGLHLQVLARRKKMGDEEGIINTLNNVGLAYARNKKQDSSIYYLQMARQMDQIKKYPRSYANTMHNMAEYFYAAGNLDSSKLCNAVADSLYRFLNQTPGKVNSLMLQGKINMLLGEETSNKTFIEQAEENFKNALALAQMMDDKNRVLTSYMALAGLHTRQHHFEKALEYTNEYIALKDAIRDSAYTRQMAEMQARFDSEKKDKEILLLSLQRKTNDARIQKQYLLIAALAVITLLILLLSTIIFRNIQSKRKAEKKLAITEKEVALQKMRSKLSMDIHDDIGSGLTKVALYAQALKSSNNIQQLSDKIVGLSKELNYGMREIIWTASPGSDNVHDLASFMKTYIHNFLESTAIQYTLDFDVDQTYRTLQPHVKRNIFLALKEALNNVVKHAQATTVAIVFNTKQAHFTLSIMDDGIGLPSQHNNDMAFRHNGLLNIEKRMNEINASVALQSNPDGGTKLIITGNLF